MTARRVITPDELAYVFELAAERPDLRTIKTDLAELAALRQRVVRGEAAIKSLAESQTALRQVMGQVLKSKGLRVPA